MNNKILAALMLIVVAGSFGIAGSVFSVPTADKQTFDGVKYTTEITKTVERINPDTGQYEVFSVDMTHNALSNAGRQMMSMFLRGYSPQNSNISVIAIGNGTGALAGGATDTTLSNMIHACGLNNQTAVVNTINQTAWDISWQWTNTCTNQVVNTTALYNNTASGPNSAGLIMFAGANLTSSTLQNTDKIQVNYTINIG